MNIALWYACTGALIVGISIHHLISNGDMYKRIIAANFCASGVFLILISMARRIPGEVPDPIPHAMVLHGLVVSACATGLLLVLLIAQDDRSIHQEEHRQ